MSKNNNKVFPNLFFDFARSAGPDCRLRFAPTPSGYLHIGNAFNFTLNWLVARLNGGKILLRIDDLDAERLRPEYLEDIFESLHWLGLDWDEGPKSADAGDFEMNWSQHQRLAQYHALLERLRTQELLFACQKSRSELAPFDGYYPPSFREQGLSLDMPNVAWRVRTEGLERMNDFVVRRRDGLPAYQIASLADDLYFGMTHIVRGADLAPSTQAQQFLARMLGADKFLNIKFLHHPLLLDAQGEKLSKSAGASALKSMREGREGPSVVFRQVAEILELRPVNEAGALLEAASEHLK